MRRKRSTIANQDNHDRWLLTYADLITLLLAFFIVMYSMSQIDSKRFGKMTEALSGILKGQESILDNISEEDVMPGHGLLKLGNLRIIQKVIDEKFSKLGKLDEIQTEITERGLVVHIMESALFQEGSADLEPRAMSILDIMYEQLKALPNHIRVEGHTDDKDINTTKYPSNWELSTSRATSVVRYFIDNFELRADRVSALGYGEFRPVRPNNSIENRAKNRRVDIVIMTMELSLKEPGSQYYDFAVQEKNVPVGPEYISIEPSFDLDSLSSLIP